MRTTSTQAAALCVTGLWQSSQLIGDRRAFQTTNMNMAYGLFPQASVMWGRGYQAKATPERINKHRALLAQVPVQGITFTLVLDRHGAAVSPARIHAQSCSSVHSVQRSRIPELAILESAVAIADLQSDFMDPPATGIHVPRNTLNFNT